MDEGVLHVPYSLDKAAKPIAKNMFKKARLMEKCIHFANDGEHVSRHQSKVILQQPGHRTNDWEIWGFINCINGKIMFDLTRKQIFGQMSQTSC